MNTLLSFSYIFSKLRTDKNKKKIFIIQQILKKKSKT